MVILVLGVIGVLTITLRALVGATRPRGCGVVALTSQIGWRLIRPMSSAVFFPNPFAVAAKRSGAQQRALVKRNGLWPHAPDVVWNHKKHKGFTSIPRTLPYAMLAMDSLCKNAPPSAPYLGLWVRSYEEMFLTIENPAVLAAESGYSGQRAVNTWNARMRSLVDLGFIEARRGPVSEFQFVLLHNPNRVMERLHTAGRFTNEAQHLLYEQFRQRIIDIGARDYETDADEGEGPSGATLDPSGATGPPGPATLTPPLSEKGSA